MYRRNGGYFLDWDAYKASQQPVDKLDEDCQANKNSLGGISLQQKIKPVRSLYFKQKSYFTTIYSNENHPNYLHCKIGWSMCGTKTVHTLSKPKSRR